MGKALLLMLFTVCTLSVFSQHPYNQKVIKYTFKNGLSYGFVNGLAQDDNGFMWFATADGLNRFDGINFKVFKHDAANPYSLPSNYIDALFKDPQGDIWISSRRGIYQFDTNTERFLKFEPSKKVSLYDISWIASGGNNVLWFSSYSAGVFSYNKLNHSLKNFNAENQPGFTKNTVNRVFQDSKGLLWVASDDGLKVFSVEDGAIKKNKTPEIRLRGVPDGRVNSLMEDHYHNIWIGTSAGLAVYVRAENRVEVFEGPKFNLASNYFYSLLEDNNHNLLIGLQDGGIYKMNLDKAVNAGFKDVSIVPVITDDNVHITERTIQSMCMDKDKNIWAATFGDGIFLICNVPEKFKRFQEKLSGTHSTGYLRYYGMCADNDGNLWMGTDGEGVFKKKINGEVIKHFQVDGKAGSLTSNNILCALMDHNKQLWFGSYAHGLYSYDGKKDQFTNYSYKKNSPEGLSSNDVRVLFEDSQNNLWVGTNGGGISVLAAGKKVFSNYSVSRKNISSNNIRAICEDKSGNIFIGTYGAGLLYRVKGSQRFTSYFKNNQTDSLLPSKVIYSIKCVDNKLLVGTEGDGLISIDLTTKRIKKYTDKNGLANNTINAIQPDGEGNIWLSTNNGLSKIESSGIVMNYDISNGLQTGHFSPNSCLYSARDKVVCFGGTEGYNIFFPGEVKKSTFEPKVIITGLQLFNKDVEVGQKDQILTQVPNKSKKVVLKPEQSVFSIQYVALNYPYAEKTEFAYQLLGLDKSWNYVQTQKSATYRYLAPGDYTFRVKASNQDGVWFNDYASLKIIILPPWYKTWYAYACYFLLAIILVYYYLRYKTNQARFKYEIKIAQITAEKEKELNEKKLSFFTNISHEFRTPLTLIISPIKELLSSKTQSPDDLINAHTVDRNARRLLSLVDQLLLFRKADSGADKLKIVKLDIVGVCRDVLLCFKHQAKIKHLQLLFACECDVIDIYADREKIEIVLFNLLSNAIKFTPDGGQINCQIIENTDDVIIQVKDSGCGITRGTGEHVFEKFSQVQSSNQSYGGFGIGLYLVKTFVNQHHGTICYESEENIGTVFNVKLLKGTAHFDGSLIFDDVVETSVLLEELMDFDETDVTIGGTLTNVSPGNYETLLSNKKTLLIVEDNIEVRQYIIQIFKNEFNVFEAENGNEGFDMTMKLRPDMVISDVMMSGLGGIELCSLIKESPTLSHIQVILLTANTLPEIKLKGIEGGADDYITKPFEKDVLIARVHGLIKSRENIQKYFYNEITLKSNDLKVPVEYKDFLEKCIAIVENHLEDEHFTIKILADEIGMSHSNLYKKIRSISDGSANEFIRYIRLRKSAEIMLNTDCTVSEAAYRVGINDPKYFREQFNKLFGENPSEYIRKFRKHLNHEILRNKVKIKR
ncbi:response regulator [Mucilaginibacter sp. BJC16-A38]|uniref:hybrid sensor histidine kinase/response regulator transcription factor n=1 Tax=Mucilaginibacter phenanthrenivorans TaxID=1234842 RepID=UPI0021583CFC|nr:hybrid sensor histidine kinase/response regulator transcription factor [Mucilaginibacter phenanthrenivorans]MCR8560653.1 response regulator [Mucilaginibacter phenanthrenivorans]